MEIPQSQSLHAPQQAIDGLDVGLEHLKALDVGLGGNWVGHSGPPLRLSALGESQSQLSRNQDVRGNSPECMVRYGAWLSCCSSPQWGWFSQGY